jgi:hypothetical protein
MLLGSYIQSSRHSYYRMFHGLANEWFGNLVPHLGFPQRLVLSAR